MEHQEQYPVCDWSMVDTVDACDYSMHCVSYAGFTGSYWADLDKRLSYLETCVFSLQQVGDFDTWSGAVPAFCLELQCTAQQLSSIGRADRRTGCGAFASKSQTIIQRGGQVWAAKRLRWKHVFHSDGLRPR